MCAVHGDTRRHCNMAFREFSDRRRAREVMQLPSSGWQQGLGSYRCRDGNSIMRESRNPASARLAYLAITTQWVYPSSAFLEEGWWAGEQWRGIYFQTGGHTIIEINLEHTPNPVFSPVLGHLFFILWSFQLKTRTKQNENICKEVRYSVSAKGRKYLCGSFE